MQIYAIYIKQMFKYRQFMFILRHLSQITHHFTHFEHADNKKMLQAVNLQHFRAFGDFLVPRPGIEPGWIAPLVFETSASTDSAIWA